MEGLLGPLVTAVVWGRMLLWAIHQAPFADAVRATDRLDVPWDRVERAWRPAYQWMARRMAERGLGTGAMAPVWCWHSCGGWRRAPSRGTIEALVTDTERRGVVLTLDVPEDLALLSVYGPWNDVLDLGLRPMYPADFDAAAEQHKERLFDIGRLRDRTWGDDNRSDVQACLPYLDRGWLVEVRPYDLDSTPSQGPA